MKRIYNYCGMRNAECRVKRNEFRNPKSEIRNAAGFTYVALLVAIVIIGISLGVAGKYWSFIMQREREEELLFRGRQYRTAIERYFRAKTPNVYPQTIEQLLKDDRFPQARRHLRQQFKDPVTGEEFELIRDLTKGNRITGVHSRSGKEPLRKTDFDETEKEFENKAAYSEWHFVFIPAPPQSPQPVRPGAPPVPK